MAREEYLISPPLSWRSWVPVLQSIRLTDAKSIPRSLNVSWRLLSSHSYGGFPMEGKFSLPSPSVVPPNLDIGRGYTASEAAAVLGITTYVLNERVREGLLKPIFENGDRRYSGYALAQVLGWPLSDNPRDYLPGRGPAHAGLASRRKRRFHAAR